MSQLILRKLIVISTKDEISLEVGFAKGVNLIIGENNTGKSSLIKSLFHAFGCEVKMNRKWKALIDKYALIFSFGKQEYLIARTKDNIDLFKVAYNEKGLLNDKSFLDSIEPINSYSDYLTELAPDLMDIFGINITWVNSKNQAIRVTPMHLLSFNFVDQDKGWNSIAASFNISSYTNNWRNLLIKFIVGYHNEQYYEKRKVIDHLKKEVKELEGKITHIEDFVDQLGKGLNNSTLNSRNLMESDFSYTQKLLRELTVIEREQLRLKGNISKLQNDKFELFRMIEYFKIHELELSKDHQFTSGYPDEIRCYVCGSAHNNTAVEKSAIVADIQYAQNQIGQNRQEIRDLDDEIGLLKKKFRNNQRKYRAIRKDIKSIEEATTVIDTYKLEGRRELFTEGSKQLRDLKDEKNISVVDLHNNNNDLAKIESPTRREDIKKRILHYFQEVTRKVSLEDDIVKMNGFMPVLDETGSNKTRLLYSYYVALYLYHINGGSDQEHHKDYPLKLLVIDTPNQGLDDINLEKLFSTFEMMSSEEGQVIIGNERKTGLEHKVTKVTYLNKPRQSLTREKFREHKSMFDMLDAEMSLYILSGNTLKKPLSE